MTAFSFRSALTCMTIITGPINLSDIQYQPVGAQQRDNFLLFLEFYFYGIFGSLFYLYIYIFYIME